MFTWNLPAELDDIILDHLHDDRATLAKCSLVRRSWLPTARYHTWRDLRLTCSEKELNELGRVLEASPNVARLVHGVVLAQAKTDACQWYDLNLLHLALATLSHFPAVSSITLDGLWFGVSQQTRAQPITLPSIRSLTISSCTFDTFDIHQLCSAFPSLSNLHLDGVWWGRWALDDRALATENDLPSPAPVLKELHLGSCFSRDKVIEWLLTTLPQPSIETLHLPLVSAYDTRLRDLLAFLGPSLRQLELGSPSVSNTRSRGVSSVELRGLESYLDLSQNTGLRTIQLGVPTYRDPQLITLWLTTVLAQLASPVLEEVRFAVYPILRGDAPSASKILDAFDWKEVAGILFRSQFSGLKRVVFESGRSTDYMKVSQAFVPLQPVLQAVVPTYFRRLEKRGVQVLFRCV